MEDMENKELNLNNIKLPMVWPWKGVARHPMTYSRWLNIKKYKGINSNVVLSCVNGDWPHPLKFPETELKNMIVFFFFIHE